MKIKHKRNQTEGETILNMRWKIDDSIIASMLTWKLSFAGKRFASGIAKDRKSAFLAMEKRLSF